MTSNNTSFKSELTIPLDETLRLHVGGYLVCQLIHTNSIFTSPWRDRLCAALIRELQRVPVDVNAADRALNDLFTLVSFVCPDDGAHQLMPIYLAFDRCFDPSDDRIRSMLAFLCGESVVDGTELAEVYQDLRGCRHDLRIPLSTIGGCLFQAMNDQSATDLSWLVGQVEQMRESLLEIRVDRKLRTKIFKIYAATPYHARAAVMMLDKADVVIAKANSDFGMRSLEKYRADLAESSWPQVSPIIEMLRDTISVAATAAVVADDPIIAQLHQQLVFEKQGEYPQ